MGARGDGPTNGFDQGGLVGGGLEEGGAIPGLGEGGAHGTEGGVSGVGTAVGREACGRGQGMAEEFVGDTEPREGLGEGVWHAEGVGFDRATIRGQGGAEEQFGKLFTELVQWGSGGSPDNMIKDGIREVA